MAIIWVDPYLDSAGGGIHGTTSSGSGTYSAPYSWWDLNGYNALGSSNVFNEGDEIRFKGLPEGDFWGSLQSWASVNQSNGEDYQWYMSSYADRFLKVISRYNNNKELYLYQNPGYNYLNSVRSNSTWQAPLPMLDNSGYYVFDSNKQISNPNGKNTNYSCLQPSMFNYTYNTTTNPTKVTAGWTSETTQGGITFIAMAPNWQIAIGNTSPTGQPSQGNCNVVFDCLDTLVFAFGDNEDIAISGIEVKVKAIVGANYNSSDYIYITSGFTSNPNNNDYTTLSFTPGTIKLDHIVTGSYCNIYSYAPNSNGNILQPEIFIDTFVKGYYKGVLRLYNDSSTPAADDPQWTYRLKKVFLQYGQDVYGGSSNNKPKVNLVLENNFEWLQGSSGTSYNWNFSNINVISETIGTDEPNNNPQWLSNVYSLRADGTGSVPISYSPVPPLTRDLNDNNYYALYSNSTSLLKGASIDSLLGIWYNEYIIENSGETIDTVSSSPATMLPAAHNLSYIKNSSGIGKIFVAYESTSDNAVSLIPIKKTTLYTQQPVAIEYKSPSTFSGKTCWRLFGSANGQTYSQLYRLPLPNFSNATSNYTFETFFNTTSNPGVTIVIDLWVFGLASNITKFKTCNATVTGNIISFSEVIAPTELKSGLITQLFAEVNMTKTSTANCSVAFNNFNIS